MGRRLSKQTIKAYHFLLYCQYEVNHGSEIKTVKENLTVVVMLAFAIDPAI